MNELRTELARTHERFETAVGFRGTVAIAFSAPSSRYVLKVIRDTPTDQYKWGAFEGVEAVLDKYRRVHEINRTGSMLDNIIYYNLRLQDDWFDEALREELLQNAGACVTSLEGTLVFQHLIAQPKMIPLPNFLDSAAPAGRRDCRRKPRPLHQEQRRGQHLQQGSRRPELRREQASEGLSVDYDALEPFTDIKIRTNHDRVDGEEDVPDWFFEDGVIFLPEGSGIGPSDPRQVPGPALPQGAPGPLSVDYWQVVQDDLLQGRVPSISVYPEECKLLRQIERLGTYY